MKDKEKWSVIFFVIMKKISEWICVDLWIDNWVWSYD